jgi:alkylation response protein AidB-like acyl-CoA dehydrogenase
MSDVARQLLAEVQDLSASAASLAGENEAARRVDPALIKQMRDIGLFRMFVPRTHGGLELEFPASLDILAALTAGDGAAGWVAMIGCHLPLLASALPRKSFDALYSRSPDLIGSGSVTPAGVVVEEATGYRVSGRWPFASGCTHADVLFGFCVAMRNGEPIPGPRPGVPSIRVVFAPASQWTIEDTWHAAGLRATASHHVSLRDSHVPAEMTFPLAAAKPSVTGPLYVAGPVALLTLHLGAVAVGLAEGAINDIVAFAMPGRRQLFAPAAMKDTALFQHELGAIEADVRASRALLHSEAERCWARARTNEALDASALARNRQSMTWIAATCARAVDKCFTLGGGAALYDTSPLQRRLRDAHAITQHVIVHQKWFAEAGRARLGFPLPEDW